MIWFKDIEVITKEDIYELIENQILEHDLLEYKKELKICSDKDKKEFLKDISALANGRGGLIVYGIEENEDGFPDKINAIEIENVDKEERRLQDIICSGIEPIINTFKIRFISFEDNKYVIIIKLFRSWNLPHRVIFKGNDKFYVRRNKKVDRITIEELKMMFNMKGKLKDKILSFQNKRIKKMNSHFREQTIYIHIIPMQYFNEDYYMDIKEIENNINEIKYGLIKKYNFEGLVFEKEQQGRKTKSIQFFRNGSIEIIKNLNPFWAENFHDKIPIDWIYQIFSKDVKLILDIYKKININGPYIVLISLKNVLNKKLYMESFFDEWDKSFIDIEYYFPEIIIEDLKDFEVDLFNPTLDILWQSCGYAMCRVPIN